MNDDRHEVDLYADARKADREYREAEKAHRGGESAVPAPMLLTLMCLTDDDAHEIVEQIKRFGGVVVAGPVPEDRDPTRFDLADYKVIHCSIADLRRWGEKKKVYR